VDYCYQQKAQNQGKSFTLHCGDASSREAETDVPSLTNSEEETVILIAEPNAPLVAETRSDQS